jgi:polyisoprenoid-binding protein YceI
VIDDAHSTASYTAHETFLGQNTPATPVGTTSAIDGDIVLAAGRVQPSTVTVDLRTLKTDNPMRDHHIQTDPLQTSRYPDASFAAAASPAPAPLIAAGATVSLPIAGTLTIHGTARPMTFDAKVDASGATLHLTGASSFNFSDFGLQPPNIAGFVAVEQGIQLSVDLTATRQ